MCLVVATAVADAAPDADDITNIVAFRTQAAAIPVQSIMYTHEKAENSTIYKPMNERYTQASVKYQQERGHILKLEALLCSALSLSFSRFTLFSLRWEKTNNNELLYTLYFTCIYESESINAWVCC